MCAVKNNFMNMKEVICRFSEYFFQIWRFWPGINLIILCMCLNMLIFEGLNITALFHKHLHMYFHERKCLNFDRNFIEDTHTTRYPNVFTHSGPVTHLCISKLSYNIIGSDNGFLSVCHYLKESWYIADCTYANKFQCLRKFKSKYNNKKYSGYIF